MFFRAAIKNREEDSSNRCSLSRRNVRLSELNKAASHETERPVK